jgi:sugar phosphate isomerase/epimerase
VLYEPCNLLFGGVDYREALDVFGDWIVHCYIKDGIVRDGKSQKLHPGESDVNFVWVVEQLDGADYRGDYALEYELAAVEPPETGIKRWHDTFVAAFE